MKTQRSVAIEAFGLVLTEDYSDKAKALTLVRKLTPDERQQLREACQDLDKLVEELSVLSIFRPAKNP